MSHVQKIVLENGLRVLLIPSESPSTTVAVLVAAGSKYEDKKINGISHFLEHMCFKGTKNRPRVINITSELENLGAEYNAFTAEENTSYYAKVRNEVAPKALDIVSDLYLNPIFDVAEIEKEKGVIIQEINMYEDLPSSKVWEVFTSLLYGDQPAGRPVLGSKETVKGFNRETFVEYRAAHYLPQSTVLLISGGAAKNEAEIMNVVREHFEAMPSGEKKSKEAVVERQEQPAESIFRKDCDQTHLVLGFRAFNIFDERRHALSVMADILGGGMGSRLFQIVREELGAAYYVRALSDLYTDHGVLAIAAGVDHTKFQEIISRSLKECGRLKLELVSEEELNRAKEHLIGRLALSLETSDEIGYFYANQEILNKEPVDPDALVKKIRAVTAEEIMSVARTIFKNRNLNLAAVGPFPPETSFLDILSIHE